MSTTTNSEYKKPLHRRDNSGELDVFEAARYFSGYNENNVLVGDQEKVIKQGKQGKLRPRGTSLDMPSFKQSHQYYYKEYHQNYTLARLEQHHQNQPQPPPPQQQQQQQRQQIMKENKKFKQPSSPGGKLAQFLNSIFNQSITSKKKKLPKTTLSMKDEDESPSGRKLRRSSISHFRSTSSVVDEKSYYSSSISGFQTPIIPYTINTTPTKTYQNVKSFQDYKQVLATLSKYKIQEKELAKISKDAKVIRGDDYSNNRRNYEEIKKINEDKMDDYEDLESDASSDLFELQIDDEFTFCSSGLPVYESTHMENIKQTSATAK